MANYASLKATIDANIKTNGNEEITGPVLNNVLKDMVDALASGYIFMGMATPATNPGTPDQNVFYLTTTPGTYTNFGGLTVTDGEIAALAYNGSWSKESATVAASGALDLSYEVIPTAYSHLGFNMNPNTGKWATASSTQGSKIIPLPAGLKSIILSPNSDIMMWSFLSAYTPAANNQAASIATGMSYRYSATAQTVVTYWSNAKFICVRDDQASTDAKFPDITFVLDGDLLPGLVEENNEAISDLTRNALTVGSILSYGSLEAGYVEDNKNWLKFTSDNTHLASHYIIAINAGVKYRVDAGSLDTVLYWGTSNSAAVNGQPAPVTGDKMVVKAGGSRVFQAPVGASYLLVMSTYYTSILTPTMVASIAEDGSSSMEDIIPDYIVEGATPVNLSALTEQNGTMITGGKWGALSDGRHKAFAVTPGEKYVIFGDGLGFWAWLTSSYSTPVSNNAPVPFVTGYTNRTLQKDAVAVTAPTGAAYLAITTKNGAGVASSWQIWKVSSYRRKTAEMAKIRAAHWNIGGFVYTDWQPGDPTHTIPAADADTYAQRYRELLNSIDADILGIAEYNPAFSDANLATKDVLFQCFAHQYEGTKDGANCNSIFGNIMEWIGTEEVAFTTRQEHRYYTHLTARLLGENVHFVEAHLDHTYNDKRVAQIAQLIADMSPYTYVVIVGDFNTGDEGTVETELAAFTDAGFTILNDGYLGLLVTSLTQEYVDNIVVKGFAMSGIEVSTESGTLSDHLLIQCDLTMQGI